MKTKMCNGPLYVDSFSAFQLLRNYNRLVTPTDFNQYYNLGLLKDFERNGAVAAAAAFGFGAPNDFLSPVKATTLKQYQSSSDTNNIPKIPSSPNRMTVSSTCSPTPSMQASSRLPNDAITNLTDGNNTCDRLFNESNRFDCYSNDGLAIVPNIMPSNTSKTDCNPIATGNLPSIDQFQCMLNRRQRGEKRPIPDEQKDEKYFERRKRNNEAAKKSRDARKIREDRIAFRAALLEQENAILRAQILALRDELATLQQMICNRANI